MNLQRVVSCSWINQSTFRLWLPVDEVIRDRKGALIKYWVHKGTYFWSTFLYYKSFFWLVLYNVMFYNTRFFFLHEWSEAKIIKIKIKRLEIFHCMSNESRIDGSFTFGIKLWNKINVVFSCFDIEYAYNWWNLNSSLQHQLLRASLRSSEGSFAAKWCSRHKYLFLTIL